MTEETTAPSSGPTTPENDAAPDLPPQGPEALSHLGPQLAELTEYFSVYLQSQVERAKLSLTDTVKALSLIPVALLVVAGALLLALGFMGYGIATGLTILLAGKVWLAYLITGGALMLAFGLLLSYLLLGKGKRNLKRRVREYEADQTRQRASYGHSLSDQAAAASQE